jgi:hypothetical protein
MDQVVAQALTLYKKITDSTRSGLALTA